MQTHPSHARATKRCFLLTLPVAMIAGCTVGPQYSKPEIVIPETFREAPPPVDPASFADLPWWSVFNDPALQKLVTQALANNYDIQVAVARIDKARAAVGVAQSEGKPQVGYEANAQGAKDVIAQKRSASSLTYGSFSGLINAAWELDVWGRIRRSTEAARANLLAQEDVRRGVILTLVSDLAASYFRLIELDREFAIAEDSARAYKSTLDLFTLRFNAGRDSLLPVERAQAAYDSSGADIQDIRRQIAQQENAISILIGAFPQSIERGHSLDQQATPQTPLGSTTALLQRRPDILQSEQDMMSANAEIGVAVADYFPKIGLSTFLGGEGLAVTNSVQTFGVWNLALSAAGPIYSGGRLESVYRERQAFWDETVAQYKQKVLIAFQETSDALVAQKTLTDRRTALTSQVQALQHSVDLALQRYDNGRASYFEVLEAEQQLFPAQDELARNVRDELIAVVNLYKALGGGWNAGDEPSPPETKPLQAQTEPETGG